MNRTTLIAAALVSLVVFPGWECGQPIIEDPGFDLWCDKQLCSWELTKGQVQRVATWHRSDYGVLMAGNPTVISQFSPVTSASSRCFLFELQANRDDGVTLTLEMDFLDDGPVEYSHELASDNWQEVQYRVATPEWYDGVRFIIRKQGAGDAVLSHIRVTKASDCAGPPLDLASRGKGARCDDDGQCQSGRCAEVEQQPSSLVKVCTACRDDNDCAGYSVCGMQWGERLQLYRQCIGTGQHVLGERCAADGECATGVCCEGICSRCCDGAGCAAGQACDRRSFTSLGQEYVAHLLPWQCSPGQGSGAPQAPCLQNDDCDSNSCLGPQGELKTCSIDGRSCEQNADCPLWPSLCLSLGVHGGRCQ